LAGRLCDGRSPRVEAVLDRADGQPTQRVAGIDMVRGLTILGVMLFHRWNFTTGRIFFTLSHATLLLRIGDRIVEGNLPR